MAGVAANAVFSLLLLSLVALISSRFASATEYVVGDEAGWSVGFDYGAWTQGKTFLVGDSLVFNYHSGYDVVVIVNGAGFASCQTSPNLGVLASGSDRVTLSAAGDKWYISGVSSHCDYGQKLKITVHPVAISLSPAPAPEPWLPYSFLPLPPSLSPTPTAEPPGASWPFVPVPVPASPPSSSSSSMPESTPIFTFPLPPLAGSLPPSIPGLPLPPGLPFPRPFPFPLPPSPSSSSNSAASDVDHETWSSSEEVSLTDDEAETRWLAPSAPSPLQKWGWYTPAPSPSASVP